VPPPCGVLHAGGDPGRLCRDVGSASTGKTIARRNLGEAPCVTDVALKTMSHPNLHRAPMTTTFRRCGFRPQNRALSITSGAGAALLATVFASRVHAQSARPIRISGANDPRHAVRQEPRELYGSARCQLASPSASAPIVQKSGCFVVVDAAQAGEGAPSGIGARRRTAGGIQYGQRSDESGRLRSIRQCTKGRIASVAPLAA
jgi:hypothetical protein